MRPRGACADLLQLLDRAVHVRRVIAVCEREGGLVWAADCRPAVGCSGWAACERECVGLRDRRGRQLIVEPSLPAPVQELAGHPGGVVAQRERERLIACDLRCDRVTAQPGDLGLCGGDGAEPLELAGGPG